MHGSFTVGAVATPPPDADSGARRRRRRKATASIARLRELVPAVERALGRRFSIIVSDRSATDGFRLSGPGVTKATTAKFRGTVDLEAELAGRARTRTARRFTRSSGTAFTVSG